MIRWLIAAAASIVILIALLVAMSMAVRFFFPDEQLPEMAPSVSRAPNTQRDNAYAPPASTSPSADDCLALEGEINLDIIAAGDCNSDADCAFESFGCPFGCIDAINRNSIDLVRTKARDYRAQCSPCEYRCAEPGLQQLPKCVNNQCIVFEKTIEMLQDETRERVGRSR